MMTSYQSGYATLGAGRMVTKKRAWCAAFALLWLSATLSAQTSNALTAQERAQGWQLLFDGKTIAGWHVSVPPPGSPTGAPPPHS